MERFPWPKANEDGTSPSCTRKAGRQDAHPGGLLAHSESCFEAQGEASPLVQLPSQLGEILQSPSEDITQTDWLFSL